MTHSRHSTAISRTPRVFYLYRKEDVSGQAGVGFVAEGIKFSDGSCALRWRTATPSTVVYSRMDDVVAIHGHRQKTEVVWEDEDLVEEDGTIWLFADTGYSQLQSGEWGGVLSRDDGRYCSPSAYLARRPEGVTT